MKTNWIKFGLFAMALAAITFTSCNTQGSGEEEGSSDSTAAITPPEQSIIMPVGYEVGDKATDFSLPNVDGNKVSLSDYADAKGYIVIFTCNHCPYAKAYENRIMALDKMYAEKGYPVIAISPNDPELQPEDGMEEMKARAEEKGYTFPYLLDEGQDIYPQYGATKTPHVYVLEKTDSANMVRYIGAIDNNYENEEEVTERYVEDAVNALLAGEEIAVTSTKAIGCSIKDKRKK